MSAHEQCVGATDEWYTPKYVFDAMGVTFDVDVASPGPEVTRWIPACRFLTDSSLETQWRNFVWMNPPFGARNGIIPWIEKFIAHGDGVALTPDRTSAPWWQAAARHMEGVLFVAPKIRFIGANGLPGKSPAQGTSLMAMGWRGVYALTHAAENGLGTLVWPKR